MDVNKHIQQLTDNGFSIIDNVYSDQEVNTLIEIINSVDNSSTSFRKTEDLFAIRTFLNVVPDTRKIIFNQKALSIINQIFGTDYFVVKSIYFDKPQQSNWFVAWHQDLTISVDKKVDAENYNVWTQKQGQYAVQPPVDIFNSIYTMRIHLDECDESNGALKVISGSHKMGVLRPDTKTSDNNDQVICEVKRGGIMLMRPLTMHSSSRSTGDKQRRVIHIEFANKDLTPGLEWREKQSVKTWP